MKNSKTLIISLAVIIIGFIGLVFLIPKLTGPSTPSEPEEIDVSKYQFNSVIAGNEDNGGIADHIKGNENAPVTIYEYADYQCSGCASMNPWIKDLLKEYDGKVRIVYRTMPLTSIHPSAIAAASAAEAAGLQGYWEEYADLLFSNQPEWSMASSTTRTDIFMSYFTTVAGESGDLPKFRADMSSANVKKKIKFDESIANSLGITATPSFFDDDGNEIEWVIEGKNQTMPEIVQNFRDFIDKQLAEDK